MCPFQTVRWIHSGTAGIIQSDLRKLRVTPEQLYPDNKVVRTGDLTLDEHGTIIGHFKVIMLGQEALSGGRLPWRTTRTRSKNNSTTRLSPSSPMASRPMSITSWGWTIPRPI